MVAIIGIMAPIHAKSSNNKVEIKWDANGGKIGSKKIVTTTVKKGSKIGTLQKATRTGYTLKGWYTKKTGGTKITKDTKPKKSVTYYAQWIKEDAKSIVGKWVAKFNDGRDCISTYTFKKDGTYTSDIFYDSVGNRDWTEDKGNWKISGKNTLYLSSVESRGKTSADTLSGDSGWSKWYSLGDFSQPYIHLKDSKGEYLHIGNSLAPKHYKQ